MGHLPIVNQETVVNMINNGCISTRGNLKSMWVKTTSDIFSDVLASRPGDLIFPWIIRSDDSGNLGFKYVFKVAGPPFFAKGNVYPVSIPLEPEGLEFEVPLSEAEALDLWDRELLWNAIGKKSLGRGRSLTHQTLVEDQRMLKLLNDKNPSGAKKIKLGKCDISKIPITINPAQDKWDSSLKKKLDGLDPEDRLKNIDLNGMPWSDSGFFSVEKTLEAWMMENIDKKTASSFRELALVKSLPIKWFANYLPFGVQGSNMDIVVLQSDGSRNVVSVIELKVGSLNKDGYEGAANQSIDYSIFVKRAFEAFGIKVDLNPSVLSGSSNVPLNVRKITRKDLSPGWMTYSIDPKGNVNFKRLL